MEDNLRHRYTKEYKLQVVRLIKDEQRKPSEISKDLGIETGLIYKWIRIYEKTPDAYLPGEGKATEKDEIRRLKKKIAIIAEENEILKKAMAIFSKQPKPNSK